MEYGLIAVFTAQLGYIMASLLAWIAFLMLIGSNIAFSIQFWRQARKDKYYREWSKHHPRTALLIPILSAILNFKNIRFLFSGLFGLQNTKAQFHKPHNAIHKHLLMVTHFHLVFVYGAIFFADFIIIISTRWGHQLLVLAIETTLLQALMIYLMLQEFKNPQQLYADQSKYSRLRPKKQAQVASSVAGLFEEHELDEE